MVDPKVVYEWLNKADEDFNFADANLSEGNNFYAQICFHFHQAAEKYLKAFIIAYDLEFEKIHNLINLLKICGKQESSLLSLLEECELLNPFYSVSLSQECRLTQITRITPNLSRGLFLLDI
ncbi:MAG: HEPN domain-containing protein [Nitrospirae bacterium]|nr:HEPN domain-containing protein [Nitrospirota bacterium]